MHHYVVIMWDPSEDASSASVSSLRSKLVATGRQWSCVMDHPGVVAIHRAETFGSRAHLLPDRAGVVFGSLFSARTDLDPCAVECIPQSFSVSNLFMTRGRYLLQEYCGYYAAFFNDIERHRISAVRDCSAKVPCFFSKLDGVNIYFSFLADALELNLLPDLSINWHFIATYLFATEPRTADCGFEQITQLLAGECIETRDGEDRRTFLWDPREIWSRDPITNYFEAQRQLRRVTQWCVDIHALKNRDILLQLSGGFDSTVVLGCLRESGSRPKVTCVTRYSKGPEEDERHYARLAADAAGVRLIESEWLESGLAFNEQLLRVPLLPRPSLHLLVAREHQYKSDLAGNIGASSVWSGEGGDHFFVRGLAVLFAADYLRDNGLRGTALRVIADNARYSHVSYWTIFRQLARRNTSRNPWNPSLHQEDGAPFLNLDAAAAVLSKDTAHPWTTGVESIPTGKQWQIREFADLLNRAATMLDRAIYDNPPLVSQPLMELSLRIPTYVLLRGGRHRGLARDAFSDLVPTAIRDRESKGNTNSVNARLLGTGCQYIRELLLDGILAREHLVSKYSLASALTPGKPLALRDVFPLLSTLSAEVWLRTAESTLRRSAPGN